jgi:hypothetical protein
LWIAQEKTHARKSQINAVPYPINWNIFVSPEFSRAHHVAAWSVTLSHIGK